MAELSPERACQATGTSIPETRSALDTKGPGSSSPVPPEALREVALQILRDAMAACSIENVFSSRLVSTPGREDVFQLSGEEEIDLAHIRRVLIIAVGKGAASMLGAFLRNAPSLASREVRGILIAPERPATLPRDFSFFAGGHPLPNEESFAAARAAQALLRSAANDGRSGESFCFVLLSGGASAMMELPLDDSISLADTISFHRALVHSGASIAEINCVRKHFSAVKGGRLAQACRRDPLPHTGCLRRPGRQAGRAWIFSDLARSVHGGGVPWHPGQAPSAVALLTGGAAILHLAHPG